MSEYSPLILFAYNRFEHLTKVINKLLENKIANKTDLYIYIDGHKTIDEKIITEKIYDYSVSVKGFKNVYVTKRKNNIGLANSVIDGVSYVLSKHDKVIVLEDDLIVSSDFLDYMNQALIFYKNNPNVYSITAYNFPVKIKNKYDTYFLKRCSSWGWATWKNIWTDFIKFYNNKKEINIDERMVGAGVDIINNIKLERKGIIDTWATYWCYYHLINNSFCVYPVNNKIENIGFDKSGTNCGEDKKYVNKINVIPVDDYQFNDIFDEKLNNNIVKFINGDLSFINKIKNKIKYGIKKFIFKV